jgi:hypothetical protein
VHEDYRREHAIKRGSDRSFGLVMAAAFTVVALLPLRHRAPVRWWAVAVAVGLALLALVQPRVLAPLNAVWTRIGLLLNRVTSPILMAAVFFLGVLPTGLLMRAFGRDPMRRKRDAQAASYWIPRPPEPGSMSRQF